MGRIVMFVLNDVRHDARVLREADTLAAAGHAVTIVGRTLGPAGSPPERERRGEVDIIRVPVPGRLRRSLLEAGGGRADRPAATSCSPHAAGTLRRSGLSRIIASARALGRFPILGGLIRGLDLLVRWRFGTEAWGRAAAAAAPAADVWHAHDLTAIPAALTARQRYGGRLVYDAHELFLEAGDTAGRPSWARGVLRRLERRAIETADAVVTVNDGLAVELGRIGRPRRLVVVHNAPPLAGAGGGPATTPDGRLRAAAGIPDGAPIALLHGSFASGRGVEVLLSALRERGLERVHAVFLGDGAGRAAIDAATVDPVVGLRVHRLEPVAPEEVTAWVAGADVGVMPISGSTANHRLATPNKLFECLAAGVPVVASDLPGMRGIVLADPAAPLGAVVDGTSPAAVASAIRSIVEAPVATRAALRARCRDAAQERWNWEREAVGLTDLYASFDAPPTREPVPQAVTFILPTSGRHDSRTRRMAVALAGRGHTVRILARTEVGLPAREDLGPGVAVERLEAGLPPESAPPGSGPLAWVLGDIRRIVATAARTRIQTGSVAVATVDGPGDVVHAMGFMSLPVAADVARRTGVPFVYDARDLYGAGGNIARLPRLLQAVFAVRERTWARRAAAVITVNDGLAGELVRRFGIDRPPIVMNAQEVPDDPPDGSRAERPDLIRSALGLPVGTSVVLYHGGFLRDRGFPELIAAMRSPGLEAAHLVLMGAGPLEAELDRLAADPRLGGRVHRLPPVMPAELLDWVASADVGAMPNQPRTLNERLSTPNKLFECLAAGTPVVSSDFPERRRMIVGHDDGPLGALCDPTDPISIGAAIHSILSLEPAAADKLRARCRQVARARYAWPAQMAVLLEVYGRVTGRPW